MYPPPLPSLMSHRASYTPREFEQPAAGPFVVRAFHRPASAGRGQHLPAGRTLRTHVCPRALNRSGLLPQPRSPLGAIKLYNDESPRQVSGAVAQRSGSPSNRARLARIHQNAQLRELLYTRLQVEGVVSKRDVGRKGGEVNRIVEQELNRIAGLESIKALPLPGRFDPGLRPNTPATRLATPDLKHALETAVVSVRSALEGLPSHSGKRDAVATPPSEPAPPVKRSPRANAAAASRRLPHVSVLGRMVPIDQVLREKIQAKYHGGVHPSTHLLRALKQLDSACIAAGGRASSCASRSLTNSAYRCCPRLLCAGQNTSTISIDEFALLMAQFNLNLKTSTLQSLLVALGLDERMIKVHRQVPYYAFVQAIMPTDYPQPGRFVTSIVDRARGPTDQDPGLVLVNELLAVQRAAAIGECVDGTTADSFEDALRAKLQAKVVSGPTELLSQFRLFDKDKKGWITTEEFVKGCAMFNLFPSAEVMAEIVARYFDEHGRISFAVFVTSIIDAFDFPKARLNDPACSSLLAGTLSDEAAGGLWATLRDASAVDSLPRDELLEICLDESSEIPLAAADLEQLLDSCPKDDEGQIGLRGFGSDLASTLLASNRAGDAKDKLWDLLNATGLPGLGLPWSHGIDANRPFDPSVKYPSSDAAAAALFKAGESSSGEEEHPVDDPGTLSMWGSLDTVEELKKNGMDVDPTKVMAAKLAQKTLGPKQYSDLPKMFHKFAHDPKSMTRDEFAAFLQEGLNSNLGRDDVEELANTMGADGAIDFRRVAALAHPSDYPKKDGKYGGVLTLTHPSHAVASTTHVPWEPRAPDGLTQEAPIDPVQGMLSKAVQKSEGAKSAEGAELQALLAAFKHFDTSDTGTLSVDQIGRVLTRLSLPASQTNRLLEALGENSNGQQEVNYRSLCDKVRTRELASCAASCFCALLALLTRPGGRLRYQIMAPSFARANDFKWLESLSEISPLPKNVKAQWPSDSEAKSGAYAYAPAARHRGVG